MKKTRKTKLSITAIEKDLTFSKKSVWLWVKLPATEFEFLGYRECEQLVINATTGYNNILITDDKPVEAQIIRTTTPFNTQEWSDNLFEEALKNHPSEKLPEFMTAMETHVNNQQFNDKKVLLGIKLGARTEYSNSKNPSPLTDIFNSLLPAMGVEDYAISEKELNYWTEKGRIYKRSLLTGNLQAEEITAQELAYVVKKYFYPAMTVPDVDTTKSQQWGIGDIDFLADSDIENGSKYLKITQTINGYEYSGYRTVLCFAKFPDSYSFPDSEPWIHWSSSLPFVVDFYSRFTIEPSRKVRRDVNKKIAEIKDQAVNMTSAGGGLNIDIQERYDEATQVEYDLSKNKTTWLYGQHRLIIEAPTESALKDRVQKTIDYYKDLNIQLVQPTGDQLSLFLEGMPNDYPRIKSYVQRQELAMLPAGMPTGSGSVGDKKVTYEVKKNDLTPTYDTLGYIGPYLGFTRSRVVSPVFYSLHSSLAAGAAPGCAITGASGSGKSFLAFTLTYHMALMGAWTIYIDPKGDAIPLAQLSGIKDKVNVLDLHAGYDGMLDPFTLGLDPNKQRELAFEVILLFMGGEEKVTSGQRVEISNAINAVAELPLKKRTLNTVVEILLNKRNENAVSVGQSLDLMRGLKFANLCFSTDPTPNRFNLEDKLTIITLTGLEFPTNTAKRENYSTSNKLAVAIMFLLTDFVHRLMLNADKTYPKAIVIDEAWAVLGTPQGLNLITRLARMGRSANTGLILATQNAKDLTHEGLENNIPTRIAFKSESDREIEHILDAMGLDHNENNMASIRNLEIGNAIMKDPFKRLAHIKVDNWNQEMNETFESNPEKKRRQEEEKRRILEEKGSYV